MFKDSLTALGIGLLLLLAIALGAPYLIDFTAHRARVDAALTKAVGLPVSTQGELGLRFLPAPALAVGSARMGTENGTEVLLDRLRFEVALLPLLKGEVRFNEMRIGQAQARFIQQADIPWTPPQSFLQGSQAQSIAIDNLLIRRLILTKIEAVTGRMDQTTFEDVAVSTPRLSGPWRIEARFHDTGFRLSTGEVDQQGRFRIKMSGGGSVLPRLDIDGTAVLFSQGQWTPRLDGQVQVTAGPPVQAPQTGLSLPMAFVSNVTGDWNGFELQGTTLSLGEEGKALNFSGFGKLDLSSNSKLSLDLQAKRLDLDAFFTSRPGQELSAAFGSSSLNLLPFGLSLKVTSEQAGLAADEARDLLLEAHSDQGRWTLTRLMGLFPGESRVTAVGEIQLGHERQGAVKLDITSAIPERLARMLTRIGWSDGFGFALTGLAARDQSARLSADLVFRDDLIAARRFEIQAGDSVVSGGIRYASGGPNVRPRLDAQLGLKHIDLSKLPQLPLTASSFEAADFSLQIEGQNLRYKGNGTGRIAARLSRDKEALSIEAFEFTDIAGASGSASGRLDAEGGRIDLEVKALSASPPLTFVSAFLPSLPLSPLVNLPQAISVKPLTFKGAIEAKSGDMAVFGQGTLGDATFHGRFNGQSVGSSDLSVEIKTPDAAHWARDQGLSVPDGLMAEPASLVITGREQASALVLDVQGEWAGLSLSTLSPSIWNRSKADFTLGQHRFVSADTRLLLKTLGIDTASYEAPLPLDVIASSGPKDPSTFVLSGTFKSDEISIRAVRGPSGRFAFSGDVETLSLPWLLAKFALGHQILASQETWPTVPFGPPISGLPAGSIALGVKTLDLGRGIQAKNATFVADLETSGLALRELNFALEQGRVTGTLAVRRQGERASLALDLDVQAVPLRVLSQDLPFQARISGGVRAGSSGENVAALIANLAGGGVLHWDEVSVPNLDPAGLLRTGNQVLSENKPLDPGRIHDLVVQDLSQGPFMPSIRETPVTLTGGMMRIGPIDAKSQMGVWQGQANIDWRMLAMQASGLLSANQATAQGASEVPQVEVPQVYVEWNGPLASLDREIKSQPLINSLAALLIEQELKKTELLQRQTDKRFTDKGIDNSKASQPKTKVPLPPVRNAY